MKRNLLSKTLNCKCKRFYTFVFRLCNHVANFSPSRVLHTYSYNNITCTLINMLMIVLLERIKELAEDTSLPEKIHKCKLTIHIDYMYVVGQ